MNKILTFFLGVILTLAVIFLFFNPNKEVNVSELEGDVRGIYGKLVELGYTQDLTDDDIQLVVEKIQEASNWIPQGTVTSNDVIEGKTFYNKSRDLQTGTYVPEEFDFLGNASQSDVLEGKQFYSNTKELLTGTLKIPVVSSTTYRGDALVTDVMSGKKFYSNSGTLLTGTWTFLGDAAVDQVLEGKKFYSNSGTLLTGTYTPPTPIDFSNMQYSTYDDYAGGDYLGWGGTLTDDYQGEESEWSNMSVGEDIAWRDERTGVYWSAHQGTMSNIFTMASCDYFTSIPRSSYDGSDSDCGLAINYCATLDFAGRTDWYLPSQKELMQAYIDGIYNQAGIDEASAAAFVTDNYYWSSSEVSRNSDTAWYVSLYYGSTGDNYKTSAYHGVRCVSRD
ncbi:MAG TPA: DUF1566 domain-containing protein [Candidatus Dojkabacteria bacterium]|nr:DUF1566 domain-containing protein [Candidatus Dojkabacteria bacterium]